MILIHQSSTLWPDSTALVVEENAGIGPTSACLLEVIPTTTDPDLPIGKPMDTVEGKSPYEGMKNGVSSHITTCTDNGSSTSWWME